MPQELEDALPEEAEDLLKNADFSDAEDLSSGIMKIVGYMMEKSGDILRQRLRGASSILLAVVLCGAAEGFCRGTGADKAMVFLPMAGALTITLVASGSLDTLMGLGARTIEELSDFSQALLPALAAAAAAAGGITTATIHQVATVAFVGFLVGLINRLLMPLTYLYIGILTASAMLPESRLDAIAGAMKKIITWALTCSLLLFTIYLSLVRIVSGTADGTAVRVAKAAISGAVPVVGGILAEASETVLAGAGMLKNTIGIFGMLAVLAACAYPFLQLGIQYLLYKLTALLASTVGAPSLCKLIDGLGGAFGLMLGMTGSCALLLLISLVSSVAAVAP